VKTLIAVCVVGVVMALWCQRLIRDKIYIYRYIRKGWALDEALGTKWREWEESG
jgi:hypothetical protein